MSTATTLFLQGFSFGIGIGVFALGVMVVWGSFVKSVNSI